MHDPPAPALLLSLCLCAAPALVACGSSGSGVRDLDHIDPTMQAGGTTAKPPSSASSKKPARKPTSARRAKRKPTIVLPDIETRRGVTNAITSGAELEAFARVVGGEKLLKLVVDVRTGAVAYFDTRTLDLHSDFVLSEVYAAPPGSAALASFARNLTVDKPEFLLCDLILTSSGVWTLSFWEGDEVTAEHIRKAHQAVTTSFPKGSQVMFRPLSASQRTAAAEAAPVPVVQNKGFYAAKKIRATTTGQRVGRLRVVDAEAGVLPELGPRDVVVLTRPLVDLGGVAGVVTSRFEHPLSHAALRADAGRFPHAVMKDADKKGMLMMGQTVVLDVGPESAALRAAQPAEVAAWEKQRRALEPAVVAPNVEINDVRRIKFLRSKHAGTFGVGAASIGEINATKPTLFAIPEGFAVPLHYYAKHLEDPGLKALVAEVTTSQRVAEDAAHRREKLAELRKAIETRPLDKHLAAQVRMRIHRLRLRGKQGVLLRPSVNAVGLAEPARWDERLHPRRWGHAKVPDGIRRVWASLWTEEAFVERQRAGLDHAKLGVGVLIMVGSEEANSGDLLSGTRQRPEPAGLYRVVADAGPGLRRADGKTVLPERVLFDRTQMHLILLTRGEDAQVLSWDPAIGLRWQDSPGRTAPVLDKTLVYQLTEAARHIAATVRSKRAQQLEWYVDGGQLFISRITDVTVR